MSRHPDMDADLDHSMDTMALGVCTAGTQGIALRCCLGCVLFQE